MLTVKYFGMLAEAVGCEEENLSLSNTTVESIKKVLLNQYPALKDMSFKIAVNHKIIDDHSGMISDNAEIALLPPFAGG